MGEGAIKEELEELERREYEILAKMERYKETHGSEFFKPFPHQQQVLDLIHAGKKTVVLHGGNQCGKTTLGANVVCSFLLGYQPWDKKPSIFGNRPVRGRIICTDWEHHAGEVIVPALKKWLIAGTYETGKNNVGVEAFWKFSNGSTLELMTQIQDTKIHEGWAGDFVWNDEEFQRDKYTANKRGLVANNGVMLITLTEVKEGWILDDLVLSNDLSVGCVIDVPMEANTTLTKEAIKNFAAACTEEEREARVYGKLIRLVGRVYKEFNKDIHIIKPFEVPHDWPVVAMIDLHLAKPQAIGFYATDRRDINYVIDEVWEHLSPEEVADKIIKRRKQGSWNLRNVYIDPLSKGDDAYFKNRLPGIETSYAVIDKILIKEGIRLHVASKDKQSGIRNVKNWLRGVNKLPTLYIFDHCERHLYEFQRFKYNDAGEPEKENDDFMENLYRFTLVGNKFREKIVTCDRAITEYDVFERVA